MNGYWYPWTRDARAYRWAWRRIVRLFGVAGARNVRFVWSVNANLYEPEPEWLRTARRYWPGRRYVDAVASTMIDFGGDKDYTVARFVPRLRALHEEVREAPDPRRDEHRVPRPGGLAEGPPRECCAANRGSAP